ncbi:MAG: hypothetical protein GY941_05340 [Planctomycetes bacterium]|nr:hypothetical protein [Planctomycetota bacterium]
MSDQQDSSYIYCTWAHRKALPKELNRKFKDLDHFIRQLLSTSQESILIIAPYMTPEGIRLIKDSIFMSAERGAWIRIVTGEIDDESNRNKQALQELTEGEKGSVIKSRLRILLGTEELSILLHSKIIIIDSRTGYLGSANISFSAFEKNFEVGVELSADQASSFESLVSYWESSGLLKDETSDIFT